MIVTVFADLRRAARGRTGHPLYCFEGGRELPTVVEPTISAPPSRLYRNPVVLAQEWQRALDNEVCARRADLARELGISRPRITQVLHLLELTPEVLNVIVALGDPLPRPIVSERMLRSPLGLPADEQQRSAPACSTPIVITPDTQHGRLGIAE